MYKKLKSKFGKATALIIALTLALVVAVSGSLAYIVTSTDALVNLFSPSYVACSVTDTVTGNTKTDVVITNTGTASAYIRVAIVANWYVGNEIVAPEDISSISASTFGDNWVKGSDGFFYYKLPVAAKNIAPNKFEYTAGTAPISGANLKMAILAQAIQATPKTAVSEAWGSNIAALLN